MITLQGTYGEAIIFTDTLKASAAEQIRAFCNQPFSAGNRIRIMSDVHAGKGCTIGTTMTVTDKIVPNVVRVDIGCGMLTVKIAEKSIDFRNWIASFGRASPYGRDVRSRSHRSHGRLNIYDLRCIKKIDIRRSRESLGTLGGGNHFIEVDSDGENLYLVIHTGSRNLGLRVADYYQKVAYQACGVSQS